MSHKQGGLGALHALGLRVRCADAQKEPEIIFGRHLSSLEALSWPAGHPAASQPVASPSMRYLLEDLEVEVACDVNNPFVGGNGAVAVECLAIGLCNSVRYSQHRKGQRPKFKSNWKKA